MMRNNTSPMMHMRIYDEDVQKGEKHVPGRTLLRPRRGLEKEPVSLGTSFFSLQPGSTCAATTTATAPSSACPRRPQPGPACAQRDTASSQDSSPV